MCKKWTHLEPYKKKQPRKKQMFLKMTNIISYKGLIDVLEHKIEELSQRVEKAEKEK